MQPTRGMIMPEPLLNIVAGVAAPDPADPTLRAAFALARGCGATLHLVHAFDAPRLAGLAPDNHSVYVNHRASREVKLRDHLREAAKLLDDGGASVAVRPWVYATSPGEAILSVARRVYADQVIVGASRHNALERTLLGTAAQRVVRGSPAPVLVVRGEGGVPERVLLTTDFSELSADAHERALDALGGLFPGATPRVRALTVIAGGPVPPPLPHDVVLPEAWSQLESWLAARRPRPFAVEPALRGGTAAPEIVAEAEAWDADLLVLGTHARRGVERFFVGSVAESAMAHVRCSVLIVPPAPVSAAVSPELLAAEPVLAGAHA